MKQFNYLINYGNFFFKPVSFFLHQWLRETNKRLPAQNSDILGTAVTCEKKKRIDQPIIAKIKMILCQTK